MNASVRASEREPNGGALHEAPVLYEHRLDVPPPAVGRPNANLVSIQAHTRLTLHDGVVM